MQNIAPPEAPDNEALQRYLTAALYARIPDLKALSMALAGLLGISENGAYKKIKGINAFSGTELMQLARAFNISLDTLAFGATEQVTVSFAPLAMPYIEPLQYMQQMLANLETASRVEGLKIWFATTELQIFHYFAFPELSAFKMSVLWNQAWAQNAGRAPIRPETFSEDEQFHLLRKKIMQLYNRLDSAEFWSSQVLENTLNQIDYHAFSNPGQNEYCRMLCDQLRKLLLRQRQMAEKGCKFPPDGAPGPDSGAFELYHNEMIYAGNTYLIDTPVGRSVISVFNNPNFFQTTDKALGDYTAAHFERLTDTSLLLSHKSEKLRNNFFGNLMSRVQNLEERLG